jgi:MFS family permease
VIALFTGFGMFLTLTLIPRFVQSPERLGYGFGVSVLGSALFTLPGTVMIMLAGPLTGVVSARHGTRVALLVGTPLLTASLVLFAIGHGAAWLVILASGVGGLGTGMAYASGPQIIARAVPQAQMGEATGMNTLMRTVGGAVGGQIGATLLLATAASATSPPRETGYTLAFATGAAVSAAAIVVAIKVPKRRATKLVEAGLPTA